MCALETDTLAYTDTANPMIAGATLMRPGERPVYCQYSLTEQGFVGPGVDFAVLSFLPGRTGYLYREEDGREWTFDTDGHLQQMQDRNGNLMCYVCDAQERLMSVTDPVGAGDPAALPQRIPVEGEGPGGPRERL